MKGDNSTMTDTESNSRSRSLHDRYTSGERGNPMQSIFTTGGVSERSARRPWLVIAGWIVALAVAIVGATQLQTTVEGEFTNGAEAAQAEALIQERISDESPVTETVIVRSDSYDVSDSAFQEHVTTVSSEITGLDQVVTSVTSYYDLAQAGVQGIDSMVSDSGQSLLVQVELGTDAEHAESHASAYLDTISSLNNESFEVLTVGHVSANDEIMAIASEDLGMAQNFGLPAALVVLIVVFGALIAAGVPIIVGLLAVSTALGLAAGISQFFELDFFVTNMIAMIGLAVGIDYSLFIIERYREERRNGVEKLAAISIAGSTASKAVVFSGLTTTMALVGLFMIPMTTFQSLAIGAILAVATSILAALTLIPAMLALLGDRINWPRRKKAEQAPVSSDAQTGFWARITRGVMRRPAISAILATTILLLASLPIFNLSTGQTGFDALPDSDIKTAFEVLSDEFYAGTLMPVEIVIDGNTNDEAVMAGAESLIADLHDDPAFGMASLEVSEANDLAVITVPMQSDINSDESSAAIDELRGHQIPETFAEVPATVLVGGGAAFVDDFNSMLNYWMPIVFAFVLAMAFIVMTVAFRSIVIPFVSIFMNLLSVGAAYGLLVLAFQEGHGQFLGLTHTPVIEAWIPVFLFCVLFGLSMDYHFFLLSRIREYFDQTGDNDEAVARGLQSTGKIITGAAMIMVVVFSAFAAGRLAELQQLGFGLAVSVFVDATIVRSVLVPSLLKMIGRASWYLPAWLSWVPNIAIEGKQPRIPTNEPSAPVAPAPGGDD